MPIYVTGLRELSADFAKLERETRLAFRASERHVAEPVQRDAQILAVDRIPRIGRRWWRMRIGVSHNVVYVAPVQRGVKTKGRAQLARPNLANLLLDRAMEPALRQNEAEIERRLDDVLDRVNETFNR